VADAIVVERGARFYLVRGTAPPSVAFPRRTGRNLDSDSTVPGLPLTLLAAVRALPAGISLAVDSEETASALSAAVGRPLPLADLSELRAARAAVRPTESKEERVFLLGVARAALEETLRTPEEVLVTLTREEERVERAVGREARAAEAFLVVPDPSLSEYSRRWTGVRASMAGHHEMLEELVRQQARRVVPNLASVVGDRAAARLVAEAGGVAALARMRAGRIQLLGTRRRPSPERGPRYGILYRADGMSELPPGRRGAYARSLGALAAIAIRADATTHAAIARGLVARRDRRIAELRSRRG
jgi:hypothetical protein